MNGGCMGEVKINRELVNKVAIIQSLLFSRPIKSSPEITAKAQRPFFPAGYRLTGTRECFYQRLLKEVNNTLEYFLIPVMVFVKMFSPENMERDLAK